MMLELPQLVLNCQLKAAVLIMWQSTLWDTCLLHLFRRSLAGFFFYGHHLYCLFGVLSVDLWAEKLWLQSFSKDLP